MLPRVVESGDTTALIVILQLENELVHELRSLSTSHSTSSEVQLVAVEDVEIFRDSPKDIFGNTGADSLVPLVEDIIRRGDDQIAP